MWYRVRQSHTDQWGRAGNTLSCLFVCMSMREREKNEEDEEVERQRKGGREEKRESGREFAI